MADDLQINPASNQNNGSSGGGNPPAPVVVTDAAVPAQNGPAVIDLRNVPSASAAPANSSPTGAGATAAQNSATIPAQTPVAVAPAQATPSPAVTAPQTTAPTTGAPAVNVQEYVSPKGQKYTMTPWITEKFPDLLQLIKETESMNDEEREYWFQIMPIMTEDQIKKFRDILVNEKEQLKKLDTEYEQELNKLNEKHVIEWKEFETKEKRKALTQAESQTKAQEMAEQDALLQQLSQV